MKHLFLFIASLLALVAAPAAAQTDLRYGDNIVGHFGSPGDVITPYVKFPAQMVAPLQGASITRVQINVAREATNVYIYIKHDPKDPQPLYRQKLDKLSPGWNDIALDEPFAIGSSDVSVGFKGSFKQGSGVCYTDDRSSDGDIVYYNSQNKWTTAGGGQAIRAIVEGDALPQRLLMLSHIASVKLPYGATEATFTGSVRNMGTAPLAAYTLAYSVDGGQEQQVVVTRSVKAGQRDTFQLSVPAMAFGTSTVDVRVAQADGIDVSYPGYDAQRATFTLRDATFMRRFVCEEFTGLWCGWCPRGLVGLELMKEQYPDRFHAISVHAGQGDPMQIPSDAPYSYNAFWENEAGAPACNINRRLHGDPYDDIQRLITLEEGEDNHVAYTMTATWNADSTRITTHSELFTDIDMADPQLRVAFTVTEDSITGYAQTNYYADGRGGDFYGWGQKSDPTTDCVFNDVARGIFSSYQGDLYTEAGIVAREVYAYDFSFDLPPTVLRRKNIHVIGQIINAATGNIVNSFSVVPQGDGTTALGAVTATDGVRPQVSRQGGRVVVTLAGEPFTVDVFTLAGQHLGSATAASQAAVSVPRQCQAVIVKVKQGQKKATSYKIM